MTDETTEAVCGAFGLATTCKPLQRFLRLSGTRTRVAIQFTNFSGLHAAEIDEGRVKRMLAFSTADEAREWCWGLE